MNKIIVPAIIAGSQKQLDERINRVKDYASLVQLDVMDGKFVQNESNNFDFRLPRARCRFEAHLMVSNPKDWISEHADKVDTIIFHIESTREPEEIIRIIKAKRKKVGIAINPGTSVNQIKPFIGKLDQLLVMTVQPGAYGAPFLPDTLEKVRLLRRLRPGIDIEVDGGINTVTIKLAERAGANMFVSGSYIMKANDAKEAINNLKKQIK